MQRGALNYLIQKQPTARGLCKINLNNSQSNHHMNVTLKQKHELKCYFQSDEKTCAVQNRDIEYRCRNGFLNASNKEK